MVDPHSVETDTAKGSLKQGAAVSHGHGGKIPYPKHVWSPAGGWYGQPKNWKANTAILSAVALSIVAVAWKFSADHEERPRMPEPGRFYPSRYWSRQIIEHERRQKEQQS